MIGTFDRANADAKPDGQKLRFGECSKCAGTLATDWHLASEASTWICVQCGKETTDGDYSLVCR
mgnify:CR=1 FL=1